MTWTVGEVMTREVVTSNGHRIAGGMVTVSPRATLAAAARLMVEHQLPRLPVADSDGRILGFVTQTDLLRIFVRSDEAIRKEVAHGLLNEFPLLGRGRVQVTVVDGVVRLDGEVESGSLTGLLVRLVTAVPGVVGVENRLRPVPDPAEAEPNARPAAGGERRARP